MILDRRGPWKELGVLGLVEVVVGVHAAGDPLDDHAPPFGRIVVVGLEQDVVVDGTADEFRSLRGAEQDRAVLDDEVHREDLGLTVGAGHQPADGNAGEQLPALAFGKNRHRSVRRQRVVAHGVPQFIAASSSSGDVPLVSRAVDAHATQPRSAVGEAVWFPGAEDQGNHARRCPTADEQPVRGRA